MATNGKRTKRKRRLMTSLDANLLPVPQGWLGNAAALLPVPHDLAAVVPETWSQAHPVLPTW